MIEKETTLNAHNKDEWPPAHTAEHILNGTMDKLFHCGRAFSAHIERKKSKLDFHLPQALTEQQIKDIEQRVLAVINADVEVWTEMAQKDKVAERFNLERLPKEACETVRIVHVGDYDECLCLGRHVSHTGEIHGFRITSSRWADGIQRLVFRLNN